MRYFTWIGEDIRPYLTKGRQYIVIENRFNSVDFQMDNEQINNVHITDSRIRFYSTVLTKLETEEYELKTMGYRCG